MTPEEQKPPVDDLAPTPESELPIDADEENKDGEEGDEEEGEGGKKSGGTGGKKPAVDAKEILLEEENLEEYDSEKLIEKLKMLVWAPFSTMVPGASSFESENDLKRKMFLGQVGLMTNQIHPADIADPDLISKLEQRNQMRQEIFKAEMAAAGNAAGLAAGLVVSTPPPEAVQKREQKLQASQPREASVDAQRDAEEKKPEAEQKAQAKIEPVQPEHKSSSNDLDDFANKEIKQNAGLGIDDIMDIIDGPNKNNDFDPTPVQSGGLAALAAIAGIFNVTAQQTEYSAPTQKTELKFADPAPKVDAGPMGGV